MPVILSPASSSGTLRATPRIRPYLPEPRLRGAAGRRLRTGLALLAIFVLVFFLVPAGSGAQPRALPAAAKADRVLVLKQERILRLLRDGRVVRQYRVALGGSPVGPKTQQGDHKTPEGVYILDSRNPKSQFYKSLHISYPTPAQRASARRHGVSPGGDVFVHGLPSGYRAVGAAHRLHDWTDGCIAVTDDEMDEIWLAVADGTPIEIRP